MPIPNRNQSDLNHHPKISLFLIFSLSLIFTLVACTKNEAGENTIVEFIWTGATTESSSTLKARLSTDTAVQLAYSTSPDFSNFLNTDTVFADLTENNRIVTFKLSDLLPNRKYYYAIKHADTLVFSKKGFFTTFPEGPKSFSFAFSSCATTASNRTVFETIKKNQPLFFLIPGDLHYENIEDDDQSLYRDAFNAVLSSPRQSSLYRSTSFVYMWDDHDYGPNNSDSTHVGREAARLTYQEYVPHYPLPAGSGDVPIYQSFSVGRARFIMTDNRSLKTPFDEEDTEGKSILGKTQKEWFKQQLLNSNGVYPLIFWINSLPWIGTDGSDGWHGYTHERRELANFIKDNAIKGLIMLSGDAHMVAIDDGTNSDYADDGGAAFPVFHAAPLDRTPTIKGGPYSHGTFLENGQFGHVSVIDSGGSRIKVILSGRDSLNNEIVNHTVNFDSSPVPIGRDKEISIKSFKLDQNYPNPFNPETVIKYELNRPSNVSLAVFDVSGKKIKTLIEKHKSAGVYTLKFKATDLASGLYYYTLEIDGNYKEVRKMLLLR